MKNTVQAQISDALYLHLTRQSDWADKRFCFVLSGRRDSGKTTTALRAFEKKKHFYFSFRGLCADMASKLLCKALSEKGVQLQGDSWADIFVGLNGLAKTCGVVIFDDLDEMMIEKEFMSALQAYLDDPNRRRVFLLLVHTTGRSLESLKLLCWCAATTYQSIAEIKSAHPNRTGTEVVELFTFSGGISDVLNDFSDDLGIDENIELLLSKHSAYKSFAWESLAHHYRRPETYAFILHALALGHGRISEVGKFTGYPYNKCDKYIQSLIEISFVRAVDRDKKTQYEIINPYFKIWFQYIYPNRSSIECGDFSNSGLQFMLSEIRAEYISQVFTEACFATLKYRISEDISVQLKDSIAPKPFAVKLDGEGYIFDFAKRDKGKAVFVKIFHDEDKTVGREEYDKLECAVMRCHTFSDSHIYIFAKRRFSDSLVHEASFGIVKLFHLDRLRFRDD